MGLIGQRHTRERKENGARAGTVLDHGEMGQSEEAGRGAGGNGPPATEKDWVTGQKPRKERKNKEFLFYFLKHNFKSNLNSNSNLFANFDQTQASQK